MKEPIHTPPNVGPEYPGSEWWPSLVGVTHAWECSHQGTLDTFPTTRAGVMELVRGTDKETDMQEAPDFVLAIDSEKVQVCVQGEPIGSFWRYKKGERRIRHHQVPRMLIRRWADKKGRVVWRRAEWPSGKVQKKRPEKVMVRRDAYTFHVGVDPQGLEQHLAQIEQVTAATVLQIDQLVPQLKRGKTLHWERELELSDTCLKIFVAQQLVRTEQARTGAMQRYPLETFRRVEESASPDWAVPSEDSVQVAYQTHIAVETGLVLPDSPLWSFVTSEDTGITIVGTRMGRPTLPLSDAPVTVIGRNDPQDLHDLNSWDNFSLFMPLGPCIGVVIRKQQSSDKIVRWQTLRTYWVQAYCRHLASHHREVVLPQRRTHTWSMLNA